MSQPERPAPERIARALAYIFITKRLSESGMMALNPKYVTAEIDAVWKDYLFYIDPLHFQLVPTIIEAAAKHPSGSDGLRVDLTNAYEEHRKSLPEIDWDF